MKAILERNLIKFFLAGTGIFLIGSFPYLFFNMEAQTTVLRMIENGDLNNTRFLDDHIHFNPGAYISHIWLTIEQLFHLGDIQYFNRGASWPLFPEFFNLFLYSMAFLMSALILALIFSVLFIYLIMLIPPRNRSPVRFIIFILESLPDIFVIVIFQWLIIWFFKQTHILVMNFTSTYGDHAYVLPVICLSILPTIYIVKYLLLVFEEEQDHLYVELARGKGLRRTRILLVHILRNALITLFNQFKTIFWFGLSNLLVLELVFNIDGFITFFWRNGVVNPTIVTIGLLMVFVPFFTLLTAGEIVIKRMTNADEGIH